MTKAVEDAVAARKKTNEEADALTKPAQPKTKAKGKVKAVGTTGKAHSTATSAKSLVITDKALTTAMATIGGVDQG